jgi:hypothetical protein
MLIEKSELDWRRSDFALSGLPTECDQKLTQLWKDLTFVNESFIHLFQDL